MPPTPTRVRELSDEQVTDLREDLRFLTKEQGWSVRDLNQALGFDLKSNALRNILNDKTGKASTTRVRYDALKRIREEQLEPGVTLVEGEQPRSRQRQRNEPAAPSARGTNTGNRRGRRARSEAAEVTLEPIELPGSLVAGLAIPDTSSALVFKMGGTEFSATQQDDGAWQVVLKSTCTAAQMVALAEQVMAEGLNLSLSRFTSADLTSAE
ncbi:MAG: hypothetical protein H7Z41_12830 [Cytophagales bacterium]|nr:hypothetical protein [Armatimonadota bacterium]